MAERQDPMNGVDPITDDGPERASIAQAAPAAARSTAARLLSAADIWSQEPDITAHARPIENVAASEAPPPSDALTDTRSRAVDEKPALPRVISRTQSLAEPRVWPPQKLSLGLQGGGSFAAFAWGVLDRLLEQPDIDIDAISGASAGAVNAVLLACGFVEGGREGARARLSQFWIRMVSEASFRSLMLIGGFSPAGSSVAFGPALRSGQFDPFDLDPLRLALSKDIDFSTLQDPICPKLLVAATCVRDGRPRIFRNAEITADVVLASTCPPLVHCAVEIDGEAYWDGGYSANPPLVGLVQESETTDVLVVRITPTHDSYVPITMAAIDRRLDQITANAALDAEISALEWASHAGAPMRPPLRLFRLAAEDEVDELAERSPADLGPGFIALLHRSGRSAADRWLRQGRGVPPEIRRPREEIGEADAVPRSAAEMVLL
jgi:NTE family protein